MFDLAGYLRPPHPFDNGGANLDPAKRAEIYEARVRNWHWRINNTVLCVVAFCVVLTWALSPTGLPMLGSVAWASGTEQKINAAVAPIQTKVDAIEQQTRQIKEQQDEQKLADLRQKLFETRLAQCKARGKGEEIGNPYSIRMAELQNIHFSLTRTYYVPSDCADL